MTNTNDRVQAKPMPNGEFAMEHIAEEQAAVARIGQVDLFDESQRVLHNWYARRQKNSYELQQLAMRVSQAKSPQEAMAAWIDWSEQAMTSLSEEFRDQWPLTNKVVANDVQETIPVKAELNLISPVPDVNGKGLKRTSKAKQSPEAKQAPKTKRATKAKQAPEVKLALKNVKSSATKVQRTPKTSKK